jgi:ubiquinone/menaquinone biosynthesis C-methylase UbiE
VQTEDDLKWLHAVRTKEFEAALPYFPSNSESRVLEIGSGTGYILEKICLKYPNSLGLEIAGSSYQFIDPRIILYDGNILPFPESSFDVVFTSNVLEHVVEIDAFVEEIARVLKPEGVAIHIIPSPTWRVLTSVFHYFAVGKLALSLGNPSGRVSVEAQARRRSKVDLAKYILYAPRHGEVGNVLTEIYYFSKRRWKSLFEVSSMNRVAQAGIGFVYWGRDFFQFALPFSVRATLTHLIGSSSNLYVLRKGAAKLNNTLGGNSVENNESI